MMSNNQMQKYEQTKREIEERTLKSTQDSLKLLAETESCGFATAENLVHQGKQLDKIDKDLDEINGMLKESQKNINGIKSMFGGFKERLFGKKKNDQTDIEPIQTTKGTKEGKPKSSLQEKLGSERGTSQKCQTSVSESKGTDFESQLDANMNGMSNSLAMLKGLAEGMSEEITYQNDLIKNITDKTENADVTIQSQNKEMKKLL